MIPAGLTLVALGGALFIPSLIQRRRRNHTCAATGRADRATQFADDCLAENRDLRDRVRGLESLCGSYRRVNNTLVAFIRDGRAEGEFVAAMADTEDTPLFDEVALDNLRRALDDDSEVARWLA